MVTSATPLLTSTPSASNPALLGTSSKWVTYGFTAFDLAFYELKQANVRDITDNYLAFYQDSYLTGTGKDTYIPGVLNVPGALTSIKA